MVRKSTHSQKRRTTLTLPTSSLLQAEQIALATNLNLSAVISEALTEGLRVHAAKARAQQIMDSYKTAFSGFSEVELALLDGIVFEPVPAKRPRK